MEAKSSTRVLLSTQVVSAVGDGCFYVTSALYLTRVVGLSVATAGVFLSVAWAGGFLAATPIGRLADRWGLRRAAVSLSVAVAVSLGLATAVGADWFVLVLVGYAVAQSGLVGVRQALVAATVPPAQRVAVRARLHTVMNAGIGAGAALGGLALAVGTPATMRSVLWFDAAGFAVAAALATRLPADVAARPAPQAPRLGGVLRDRPYLAVAAVAAVLYLYMPMLSVVLPLFLAQRTQAPAWTLAAVFVANTVGVMALQVRAARRVDDVRTASRSARTGGLLLALSCLIFAAASLPTSAVTALAVALTGAALQVVGEVRLGAGAWHLGFALADPDRPGQWQSLFSSGLPLARCLGPVVLTALVMTWSGPGWAVLAGVFAAAGLGLGPVAARAARARGLDAEPTSAVDAQAPAAA